VWPDTRGNTESSSLLAEVHKTGPQFLLQWALPADFIALLSVLAFRNHAVRNGTSPYFHFITLSVSPSLSLPSCNRDSIYSPFAFLLSLLLHHSFHRDRTVAFLLITLGAEFCFFFGFIYFGDLNAWFFFFCGGHKC
jgi:hypothetical protein